VTRWDPEAELVSSISQGDTLFGRRNSASSSHLTCKDGNMLIKHTTFPAMQKALTLIDVASPSVIRVIMELGTNKMQKTPKE
jgi:hypothetical protein